MSSTQACAVVEENCSAGCADTANGNRQVVCSAQQVPCAFRSYAFEPFECTTASGTKLTPCLVQEDSYFCIFATVMTAWKPISAILFGVVLALFIVLVVSTCICCLRAPKQKNVQV
ncbi:hypothetical protein SS50377_23948 [Spironucleus salmonicida]|nr:hypothetical protein SS50377_23948 [Spironucleus salmonicida]